MWRCSACGETHEEQFDQCWNCNKARDERDRSLPQDAIEVTPPLPDACLHCHGPLEIGFLLDLTGEGAAAPSQWVKDPPQPSFWGSTKYRGKERLRVQVLRCKRCGRLEFFAREGDGEF